MRKLGIFAVSLFLILPPLATSQAQAARHDWGASYFDWSGARLDSTSTVSQIIQPLEISPQIYWEEGWHWDNLADGGYGGIQKQGNLADGTIADLAIFSVWNSISAVPGDGAGCVSYSHEGSGMSCRIPINLVAGNKYKLTFGVDLSRGPQWWMASVTDMSTDVTRMIGSIQTTSSIAKATNWNNFIEYWGEAVPCDSVPKASAKFYSPTSSNVDVEFSSPIFSRPAQPCVMSAGDTPPKGYVGDAVMRFGGPSQTPSTESMPFTKTKAQLAADKAAADKAAADKAAADKAAVDVLAVQQAADAAAKALADKNAADALAAQKATAAKVASLKKTTIICIKGKLTKIVTAVKPVCPAGYKKK